MRIDATRAVQRLFAFVGVALALLFGLASPALAHTGFESSNPSDGQTIEEPVTEISLTFSGDATPAGEGFVVLDPSGQLREPDDVTSADNLTWVLRFDEPLAGGDVGVRWSVAAPDAHPIDGSFSFTVTTAVPAPTTTTPPVDAAEEPAAPEADTTIDTDVDEPDPSAAEAATTGAESAENAIDLESFLDSGDEKASGASWALTASRLLRTLGAVGVVGGAVFAAFVLRGDTEEIRTALNWVRRAGVVLVVGSVGTAISQLATLEASWSGVWTPSAWKATLWSSLGAAIALRFIGGALVATGTKFDTQSGATASDPIVAARQLAFVGAGSSASEIAASDGAPPTTPALGQDHDEAWRAAASPAAMAGIGLVVASFLFDGHTVSEGPRWLHSLANVTHVVTAATWAGGVLMLALVIARRRRSGADTSSLFLAVRFSVVAAVSLVAAGLAGVVLSILILDSPSGLWATSWGRFLILKFVLVGIAAACGAYNHKVMIPQLEHSPDDVATIERFRGVVTVEAASLVAVTIATALLIGASAIS